MSCEQLCVTCPNLEKAQLNQDVFCEGPQIIPIIDSSGDQTGEMKFCGREPHVQAYRWRRDTDLIKHLSILRQQREE